MSETESSRQHTSVDLPNLAMGWSWTNLGDLSDSEPNSITDGPFGSKLKTEHYTEFGPRVIRLQNIGDGIFRDEKAHISEDHFLDLRKHKVQVGDLVIAALGEELPRACLIPEWLGPAVVKADCIRFKPNLKLVLPQYVNFALNFEETRKRTGTIIHGVGRPRLNLAEIKNIYVPLAPINEQRRIVAKIEELFSDLDAGVVALKRVRANLKRYRATVLNAAVAGVLQSHDLIQVFDSKNWVKIEEAISSIEQGWSPKCERVEVATTEEWGVIKTTAVQPLHFLSKENKRLPKSLTPRPHLSIRDGDVLITRAGPRNRAGVTCSVRESAPNLMVCDKIYRLRCDERKATPRYLEIVLNAPQITDALEDLKTGISDSGVNLTQPKFLALRIPLPSIGAQNQIVQEVERRLSIVYEIEAQVEANLKRAARLRQGILKRAFEGRLVPQDPSDEPAEKLLERIREHSASPSRSAAARRQPRTRANSSPARRTQRRLFDDSSDS